MAEARIEQFETEQRRLRKYYDQNKHRIPEFHLILDNSVFSIQLVAQLVLKAMEEKGMIEKSSKI